MESSCNQSMESLDDSNLRAQQEARAILRESFLSAVNKLTGQPCNILTYEKSMLQATFAGWKPDGSDVLVRNLITPASFQVQSALLRSPDILSIQFENPVKLP